MIKLQLWLCTMLVVASHAEVLRLDNTLEQAMQKHPDAKALRLDSRAQKALGVGSMSGLLPAVTYNAGWTRYEAIGSANSGGSFVEGDELQTHALSLKQPLFSPVVWGTALSGWHNRRAAISREEQGLAAFALEVKSAYVDWVAAQALKDVAEAALHFADSQLSKSKHAEELGASSRMDRLFMENNQAQARIQLESVGLQELAARRELERLLERELEAGTVTQDLEELTGEESQVKTELTELPEWQTLKAELGSARGGMISSSGTLLPDVSGLISWSNSSSPAFEYDGDYTNRTIGLQVSWSLFRGNNLAGSWAAWSSYRSARRKLDAGKLSLDARLQNTIDRIHSTMRQEELASRALEIARENLALLEQQYALGMLDATDLLAGEQSLRSSESTLVNSRVARLKAGWALQQLRGDW